MFVLEDIQIFDCVVILGLGWLDHRLGSPLKESSVIIGCCPKPLLNSRITK